MAQEKCSEPPVIREMQVKTTRRYHLLITSLPITNAGEGVEKGNPPALLMDTGWCNHCGKQRGGSSENEG